MLPAELAILERALRSRSYYTFAGTTKLGQELAALDVLLDRIRAASHLTEVHQLIDQTLPQRLPGNAPHLTPR